MKSIFFTLLFIMFAVNQVAAAEISGTYVRAEHGANGKIVSKSVYLNVPHVVLRVTGAPDGFCLMRQSEDSEEVLCTGGKIIGKTLLPGAYTVFPSPPINKHKESVSVYTQPVTPHHKTN
ncbi:hypothetical protein [Candidatus Magnetomonas plexicatena]|uniref:hypothetical protein n=1 Tax=Candidatus Magnetomonas plexicatena TaxID=2552947 RepID=UPI001C77F661|nr:hypothetical protein E2O03_001085 [Nitrospirales bacterium LBB_01]